MFMVVRWFEFQVSAGSVAAFEAAAAPRWSVDAPPVTALISAYNWRKSLREIRFCAASACASFLAIWPPGVAAPHRMKKGKVGRLRRREARDGTNQGEWMRTWANKRTICHHRIGKPARGLLPPPELVCLAYSTL
jgi:hypothetical protein